MHDNLELTYNKNMSFFKQRYSSLYKGIEETDISHLTVDITAFGINVSSNGQPIYPYNVDAALAQQVDTFLTKPTSIFKKPCFHFQQDGSPLHSSLLKDIEKISSYDAKTWTHYDSNPNIHNFPFLIMAGIGSGKHIERLISKTTIGHLIITDINYEFLKLSLHIIDWEKIITDFSKKGNQINFYIHSKPDQLAYTILNEIYAENPYRNYYIPYYTHYQSKFFDAMKQNFLSKIQLSFQGLGFFDDDFNSLNKTLTNLKHNIPVYTGGINIPEDSTLFIVASGPSLDNDIEYIKKFKDNAVIFSCGTALRVLEINGIVPDFHFEIEREEEIHDVLTTHTSKEFRDKVSLIGLNVLYDKVFTDDFKESYLYFRASDSGSSIVPDNLPKLNSTNPTVTNGAVSFACEFKWDKIYLFGADMGFKDMKNHHSKDAFHYIGDEDGKQWHKSHPGREITNTIESNFDNGEIYTTKVFYWSKQNIENVLLAKEKTIYNCSDGAKIDHAIPFHANQINIQSSNKSDVVKLLKSNFKNLNTNEDQFKEKYNKEVNYLYRMIQTLQRELTINDIKTFDDLFYVMDRTFSIFQLPPKQFENEIRDNKVLASNLLRGTFVAAYSTIYTHSMATYDLVKATDFAKESFLLISNFLEKIKQDVKYHE